MLPAQARIIYREESPTVTELDKSYHARALVSYHENLEKVASKMTKWGIFVVPVQITAKRKDPDPDARAWYCTYYINIIAQLFFIKKQTIHVKFNIP